MSICIILSVTDYQLSIFFKGNFLKVVSFADNHYFYDGNGNQIRREGLEGTTGYAYDERNRLTEISYPSALGGYTEKLSYDAAGNRIRRETEQEITTYRYDNCNRLQELRREYKNAETATTQPEMIRYTYDRQGNMLREKSMKSGEEKKYSYDSFGRMVRAEVPVESPSTREFQVQINRYDGEGLRHEMEENGRLIKFLYNEDREVVAEETSNGTITRYIRGLGIISSDSEEAKTYYHYVSDAQGSITHVLSEDAEILNHYNYDAFGNIIEKTEQVENRFCYNGEMLDSITQQYYLRARFYNPVIGRFTQEDTYYGDGLNLYQYCQANPVGYVDPSGHNVCPVVQNHYDQYQEYRKQHPEATAADAYKAVTGKDPLKKGGSGTEIVPYYPSNDGAVQGTKHSKYLMPGDIIDRYGKTTGKYFSPSGTPLDMRALPYDADLSQYRQYEVIKPFEVEASTIAPAFNKIGLGTQYRSSVSAEILVKKGIIKLVGGYW